MCLLDVLYKITRIPIYRLENRDNVCKHEWQDNLIGTLCRRWLRSNLYVIIYTCMVFHSKRHLFWRLYAISMYRYNTKIFHCVEKRKRQEKIITIIQYWYFILRVTIIIQCIYNVIRFVLWINNYTEYLWVNFISVIFSRYRVCF